MIARGIASTSATANVRWVAVIVEFKRPTMSQIQKKKLHKRKLTFQEKSVLVRDFVNRRQNPAMILYMNWRVISIYLKDVQAL